MTDKQEQNGTGKGVHRKEEYQEFIKWFALPKNERYDEFGCTTYREFGEKYGVAPQTLVAWAKRKDFKAAIQDMRDEWGKAETGNVFAGWRNSCIKGNPYAIELWLAYFLNWNKEQVIKQIQEFTEDDVFTLIKSLPKDDQEKFYGQFNSLILKAREYRELRSNSQEENDDGTDGHLPKQTDIVSKSVRSGNKVATGNKKSVRGNLERKNK